MGRLQKIIKTSKLPIIRIVHEGEVIKFNLVEELAITTSVIQKDLKTQPQIYSFICMVHNRTIERVKTLEDKKKKVWAQRFMHYLKDRSSKYFKENKTFPSQKVAESLAENDSLYKKVLLDLRKAELDRNDLESCVKSFEQRGFLLQTLSANRRSERN